MSATKKAPAKSSDSAKIEFRSMVAADERNVLQFAKSLPKHDLLFLPRDISQEKVLRAWIGEIESGAIKSLIAEQDGVVLGCGTLVRDQFSWSPHVCELRIVVSPVARGTGVGRRLLRDCFEMALSMESQKIVAQMTSDQVDAISLFRGLGFREEALLRDHVRDANGQKHDIVVLAHDIAKFATSLNAFGAVNRGD